MLILASICPHPPILIPTIGQENLEQIKKTQAAMQKLAEDFYALNPDVILIVSPHGNLMTHAFTLNTASNLTANFKNFGDMDTQLEFKTDIALAYQIKELLETSLPTQLIIQNELDHGVSVPLFYLTKNLTSKIITMGYSFANLQTHFELGQKLAEIIHSSDKKIAVVASGDLSHALTQDAPAPYNPQGKKFDKTLIELIQKKDIQNILKLDVNLIEEAAECGLKSIVILLGILAEQNYTPKILSYEGPFGVGYLVCNFELNR